MREQRKLTLSEHLHELRQRLLQSLVAVVITTVISFLFADKILLFLLAPAREMKPIYIELTEMFGVYIKIALLSGLILALPVIVYQLIMFIAPALTRGEKRILYAYLPGVSLAFISGVLFGYFVLLPPALRFLLTFGSDIATPQIRMSNYITTITTLLFWLGISFETPFVMLILSKLGIISPQRFARNRRFAILIAFILGGIVTPTFDPVNQTLVAVPIIVLYEVGIVLGKLMARKRTKPPPHISQAVE